MELSPLLQETHFKISLSSVAVTESWKELI